MTTSPMAGVFDPGVPRLQLTGSAREAEVGETLCALEGRLSNREQLAVRLGRNPAESPALVAAAGLGAHGERFIPMMRGDFTLACWNSRADEGVLARDALGGNALFFYLSGGKLRFATELCALLELLPSRPGVDREALLQWLSLNAARGSRTLYQGISALEPGEMLRFGRDGFRVERWHLPRYETPMRLARHELVEGLRAKLELAVSRSAGPGETTGILMSGGLDSTTVAALAQDQADAARRPLSSYSLVYPTMPSADETNYIDAVSDGLGLPNERLEVERGSMLSGAIGFIREWELPPRPRTLSFLVPLLERASRDGVTTILDGEGGDLLFDAPRELMADRLRSGRVGSALGLARRVPGAGPRPPWRPVLQLLREHGLKAAVPPRAHRFLRERGDQSRHVPSWIRSSDAATVVESDGSLRWKRFDGPRWWARQTEALFSGQHAVGLRDDVRRRGRMAGLASGSPLLDLDLVDFVLRMSPEPAFDPLMGRRLVREAMDGLLPDVVRLRPGKSFLSELTQRCLTGDDLSRIRGLLGDPRAELGAFVDMAKVRAELVDVSPLEHPRGVRFWIRGAWALTTAECWLRHQSNGLEPVAGSAATTATVLGR